MSDEFNEWCAANGIQLPAYDVAWTGCEYAVRHVESGRILMRCGLNWQTAYNNAVELSQAQHRAATGNVEA